MMYNGTVDGDANTLEWLPITRNRSCVVRSWKVLYNKQYSPSNLIEGLGVKVKGFRGSQSSRADDAPNGNAVCLRVDS